MRRTLMMALALLFAVGTGSASAQNFKGSGPETTRTFSLGEGLAVFEVQHMGTGHFVVRLLDADGNVISDVARGEGLFDGSKAVRIPRAGLYLFDVSASGDWDVRLRSNEVAPPNGADSPAAVRGRADGAVAARQTGTMGWVLRGFVGGALLGPIGMGLAVSFAGNSAGEVAQAAAAAQPMQDLAYSSAWRQAYAQGLRGRRQRAALMGGAVGTAVLVFTILQVVDIGRSDPGGERIIDQLPIPAIPVSR